jgi:N-formylglutamate amidohydrolase
VGTEIPSDIAKQLVPEARRSPDTDWYVDQLYDFAPDIGVTLIAARYSRYVVDLNRAPEGGSLYGDGRKETALVPVKSFADTPLYRNAVPDAAEVRRRIELYHAPYHRQLDGLLDELKSAFGIALCFDGHSIRRLVPTIRPTPFPDMILGDADGKAAAPALTAIALKELGASIFKVTHNDPFKGGHITRRIGQPMRDVHALQLEMCQDVYMMDGASAPDPARLTKLQPVLRHMLLALGRTLISLSKPGGTP